VNDAMDDLQSTTSSILSNLSDHEENLLVDECVHGLREDKCDSSLSNLPTTNAAKTVHSIKPSKANNIPLSIILNRHFRILICRNNCLTLKRKMKGVLVQIIAFNDGNSLPHLMLLKNSMSHVK
jgi:hypothetical protein